LIDVTTTDEDANELYWRHIEKSLKTIEQSAEVMRRSAAIIEHSYRIYLLDTKGHIEAAESFPATTDEDAAAVASSVYRASNDVFSGYELWIGNQRISSTQSAHAKRERKQNLDVAIQRHQDAILELEERLQNAFSCVKRSRKLIHTLAGIRARERDRHAQASPAPREK
jgi:hypothetical protein